jgi:Animal haem peroxidase
MSTTQERQAGVSRREFLGALGAGAIAPAVLGLGRTAHAQSLEQSLEKLLRGRHVIRPNRFGRLFPHLPPFAAPGAAIDAALRELGKQGGLMDAKDNLAAGPVLLITDPENSAVNRDNPNQTAGITFFGQFLDHDFTFDLNSRLGVPAVPEESPNQRTPALDLDSVYGGDPTRSPELYERRNRRVDPRLRIETGGLFEDLPRTPSNVAIIGDPRNDENLIISGFHAAMIQFHNNVVDLVAARHRRDEPDEIYRRARQLVTWHYQWIVVNEFLPLLIGRQRVHRLLANRARVFPTRVPFIPVEFQGAAYRMGHSMVRPSYRANFNGIRGADPAAPGTPFFGMIFDPAGEGQADPVDLRGFTRAPRRFIGWQTFFKFDDTSFRPNKRLDTTISTALFNLPLPTIPGAETNPTSLAQRNFLRHVTWGIPSGQAIAADINASPLTRKDLSDIDPLGLADSTPLWFYVLREAHLQEKGLQLGDVGADIVGRVFVGMLELDRNSYLSVDPRWRPTLPDRFGNVTGHFTIADLLTFAGVVDRGPGSPPSD